jgi:hypothetical protein
MKLRKNERYSKKIKDLVRLFCVQMILDKNGIKTGKNGLRKSGENGF